MQKKIKNLFLVHWPVKFGVQTFNSCSQQTHVLLTRTDNQNVDQSKSHQGSHSQKNKILHTRANPCKLDPLAPSASGKPLLHVYINTIYVKLCSGSMEANHPTFFSLAVLPQGCMVCFIIPGITPTLHRFTQAYSPLHNAFKLIFEQTDHSTKKKAPCKWVLLKQESFYMTSLQKIPQLNVNIFLVNGSNLQSLSWVSAYLI